MEIPWKLQQLLSAVIGEDRVKNRREFRPDFSARGFARSLPASAAVTAEEGAIARWFLERPRPDFLLPMAQVQARAQRLAQDNPHWRGRILAAAEQTCSVGLPVYHVQLAPLTLDFPWDKLKRGPLDDPLYLSRPQRFGFAPVLAQAALFDRAYLSRLGDALASWQAWATRCPYRWPYNSNHAVIYRLIALCISWTFVGAIYRQDGDNASLAVLYRILSILRNDVLYLAPRLGRSHPNNHLLADYFGGWLIQYFFPETIPAGYAFDDYQRLWDEELLRQFYPDGGSFEHAIHYQEHGCEFAMLYALHVAADGMAPQVHERIGNMLKFQARLAGPGCRPWELGDTTEDTLLPLDDSFGWSSAAIARVHDALYPASALGYCADDDLKAFWLLAGEWPTRGAGSTCQAATTDLGVVDFSQAGFVHWLQPAQGELLFRTGVAPGAAFINGHMHADILSLYWRLQGVDVLGASGTFTYRFADTGEGNYRDYFCGPWSHSTLVIRGEDPLGVLDRGFRRRDNGLRVHTHLAATEGAIQLCEGRVESDNVYNGLRRRVLQFPEGWCLVQDLFTPAQQELEVDTVWHFGEQVKTQVASDSGAITVSNNGRKLASLHPVHPVITQVSRGDVSPPRGWQSLRYASKSAVDVAVCRSLQQVSEQWWILSPQGVVKGFSASPVAGQATTLDIQTCGDHYTVQSGPGDSWMRVNVKQADGGPGDELRFSLPGAQL